MNCFDNKCLKENHTLFPHVNTLSFTTEDFFGGRSWDTYTQRPTCFEGSRPWLDYHRSTSTTIFPYCSQFSSAAFSVLFSSISLFLFSLLSFPSLSSYFLLVLSFPSFHSHLSLCLFILCRLSLYYTGSPVYMCFPSIRHNVPNDGGRG